MNYKDFDLGEMDDFKPDHIIDDQDESDDEILHQFEDPMEAHQGYIPSTGNSQ